jgi:hypothetical protein
MARSATLIGLGACWTTIAAAQTAELAADVEKVVQTLASAGVTGREEVLGALEAAWAAERDQEYALLRRLGITPTDAEFDGAWQNQPGRAPQFVPYDVEEWTTDVVRSWAKVHPREAFTWMFAVRSRFGLVLPRRSCFERVTTDWARMSAEAGRQAEAEALAIRDETLREEAVIGVIRGNILRGDPRRVGALSEYIVDPARRREIQALYARYFR